MIPTIYPTHITLGALRALTKDLPDETPLCVNYNDTIDDVYIRVEELWLTPEGPSITISLTDGTDDEEDEDDEDPIDKLPAPGTHCPDDACPGVIGGDRDRACSHCGTDYQGLEHDGS